MGIVIYRLAFHSLRVLNPMSPKRESWEVKEVINGTTLNATQDKKSQQLQLCGIEIAPGAEQQGVQPTYVQNRTRCKVM